MANVATFGEIMLRLSPPGKELLFQCPVLRAQFGGGEANVAVSLAILGHRSRWISIVPANPAGEAALRELRRYGVDTGAVVRGGRRLGLYFAETGANERPSQVFYDRDGSGIAEAGAGAVDWDAALGGMDWLHVTGITPALSATAAALTLEAVKAARAKGMTVSLDLNYRAKLWKYGRPAPEVMRELAGLADLAHGERGGLPEVARHRPGGGRLGGAARPEALRRPDGRGHVGLPQPVAGGRHPARELQRRLEPLVGRAAEPDGIRRSGRSTRSARSSTASARATPSPPGSSTDWRGPGASDAEALEFAVAAAALKHTIPGDFNLSTEREIAALVRGDRSGRVRR